MSKPLIQRRLHANRMAQRARSLVIQKAEENLDLRMKLVQAKSREEQLQREKESALGQLNRLAGANAYRKPMEPEMVNAAIWIDFDAASTPQEAAKLMDMAFSQLRQKIVETLNQHNRFER